MQTTDRKQKFCPWGVVVFWERSVADLPRFGLFDTGQGYLAVLSDGREISVVIIVRARLADLVENKPYHFG